MVLHFMCDLLQGLGGKLEIFPKFISNEVCGSIPNFFWIQLRVFYLPGGFPQPTLLIGTLQDLFSETFKVIDFEIVRQISCLETAYQVVFFV